MDSENEQVAASSGPADPGPVSDPLGPDTETGANESSPPLILIAIGFLAAALALFAALALIDGERSANLRLSEAEAGLSTGVVYAAQAVETRLDLVVRRARERGPNGANAGGSSSLRRLEATPDPLIESVRTIPAPAAAVPGITLTITQGRAVTILTFPAREGDAQSTWLAVQLAPNWLKAALHGGAASDRLAFVIAAPDGQIADAMGNEERIAALLQGDRVSLDLFGVLGNTESARAQGDSANPVDGSGTARLWKSAQGELLVAGASVAPGFTLIAAAPSTPQMFAWNGRLERYALLGAVPLLLGVALIGVLYYQRRRTKEVERQLQARDTLLNLAITSTGCGLWDWDLIGGRIFWSGPLLALTERPARGTWLTLSESYQLLAPDDVRKLDRIRGNLEAGAGKVETVIRLQDLHGRTVWCEARLRLWQEGTPRIVGLFVDITDAVEARQSAELKARKIVDAIERGNPELVTQILDPQGAKQLSAATLELEKSRLELAELSQKYAAEKTRAAEIGRAKNEFLANMSHELKTPLNAIIGFSEIMQNELYGSIGDERYRGYALDIYESGRQLASLIDDILEMSKIESGRIELNIEDLDLSGLASECVRLIEPRARDAGIAIDNLIAEAPLAVADRRATKRILMNLLSNAVKFTPRGGRVELNIAGSDSYVTVSIEDNGIGIAEDDLDRIFSPFEQVEQHQSRTHRGTGLGLAISKALSEMQGGALRIESTQGVGTKVSLDLPRVNAQAGGGPEYQRAS